MKPRVLIVGRTRFRLPLSDGLSRKFDALAERMELRVLAGAASESAAGDSTFRLRRSIRPRAVDGPAFHLTLPLRVARELRSFDPDVVLVQGAHEASGVLLARALARSRARIVLDVHGDWRAATRLYGSSARRLLNPLADRVAMLAVRKVDAVRTVSGFTTQLAREAGAEPAAMFPAFMDISPFLEQPPAPLPVRPAALFVGVLERYKNIDGLAAAWRSAARRVPGAELRIAGIGTRARVVERLVRDLPQQTRWLGELSSESVVAELDRATCLVLPSPCEGMGRVVVEALCRGRPVLGADAGGIPELVRNDVNGILVDPGDTAGLATALVRLLSDRALAERLASRARPSAERYAIDAGEFADALFELVTSTADQDVGLARSPPLPAGP